MAPEWPSNLSYAALKSSLNKYGRTGVATYLGLSTCVTAGALLRFRQADAVCGIRLVPCRLSGCTCMSHQGLNTSTFNPVAGFYIAIEQHFDAKKFLGIEGEAWLLLVWGAGACTQPHIRFIMHQRLDHAYTPTRLQTAQTESPPCLSAS